MIWHCEANFPQCSQGHVYMFRKAGVAEDRRRLVGHLFACCQQCKPSTFYFGIACDLPSPMLTCYEITKPQYDQWVNSDDDRITSTKMLHLLGYHPNYREAVHG